MMRCILYKAYRSFMSRGPFAAGLAILALGATQAFAQGVVDIVAPTITVPASANGESGILDVLVTSTLTSQPTVAGWSAEVQMTVPGTGPGANATLNVGSATTTPDGYPYIFGTSSTPTVAQEAPNDVAGTDGLASGAVPLSASLGLLSFSYDIPAGATGTFPLDLVSNNITTGLVDGSSNPIAATFVNGSITVTPTPEPSTIVTAIIAAGTLLAAHVVRMRRQAASRPAIA